MKLPLYLLPLFTLLVSVSAQEVQKLSKRWGASYDSPVEGVVVETPNNPEISTRSKKHPRFFETETVNILWDWKRCVNKDHFIRIKLYRYGSFSSEPVMLLGQYQCDDASEQTAIEWVIPEVLLSGVYYLSFVEYQMRHSGRMLRKIGTFKAKSAKFEIQNNNEKYKGKKFVKAMYKIQVAFMKLAEKSADLMIASGETIARAAKATGHGVVKASKAVGSGAKCAAKGTCKVAKGAAKGVGHYACDATKAVIKAAIVIPVTIFQQTAEVIYAVSGVKTLVHYIGSSKKDLHSRYMKRDGKLPEYLQRCERGEEGLEEETKETEKNPFVKRGSTIQPKLHTKSVPLHRV